MYRSAWHVTRFSESRRGKGETLLITSLFHNSKMQPHWDEGLIQTKPMTIEEGFPFAGLSHVLDIFLRPGPVWADKHSLHAGAKLKRFQGL